MKKLTLAISLLSLLNCKHDKNDNINSIDIPIENYTAIDSNNLKYIKINYFNSGRYIYANIKSDKVVEICQSKYQDYPIINVTYYADKKYSLNDIFYQLESNNFERYYKLILPFNYNNN